MKLTELTLRIPASYEDGAGHLRGIVVLKDENGSQTITLTNSSIISIIHAITAQVVATAKHNAKQVQVGMDESANSVRLLEHTINSDDISI